MTTCCGVKPLPELAELLAEFVGLLLAEPVELPAELVEPEAPDDAPLVELEEPKAPLVEVDKPEAPDVWLLEPDALEPPGVLLLSLDEPGPDVALPEFAVPDAPMPVVSPDEPHATAPREPKSTPHEIR